MRLGLQEYFNKHPYKVVVRDDLYSINRRLKEIDNSYFLIYDTFREKYEVHSTDNGGASSYCFTVPFDELDARTLVYARETNVATRGDKIFEEMEKKNEEIERSIAKDRQKQLEDIGREVWDRAEENKIY